MTLFMYAIVAVAWAVFAFYIKTEMVALFVIFVVCNLRLVFHKKPPVRSWLS